MSPAPRLIVAIGNASRGDDAIGPVLAERLRASGRVDGTDAELMEVMQLQVEDVLALEGRRAVLFVDASRQGGAETALDRIVPQAAPATAFTHALPPASVLALHERVLGRAAPPAWLLAVPGAQFELGAPLSGDAAARIEPALARIAAWLDAPLGLGSPAARPA